MYSMEAKSDRSTIDVVVNWIPDDVSIKPKKASSSTSTDETVVVVLSFFFAPYKSGSLLSYVLHYDILDRIRNLDFHYSITYLMYFL